MPAPKKKENVRNQVTKMIINHGYIDLQQISERSDQQEFSSRQIVMHDEVIFEIEEIEEQIEQDEDSLEIVDFEVQIESDDEHILQPQID